MEKAIVVQHYQENLTGTWLNAFEYYIKIREYNPEIKFFIVGGTPQWLNKLIKIYQERYVLNDMAGWKKGIINITNQGMHNYSYKGGIDRALILDFGTIPMANNYLKHCKEIVQISELHTDNPLYRFDDSHNVVKYGEMPFVEKDHEYRMKLGFERYKELGECEEGIFVSSRAEESVIEDKLKLLPNKPVFKKSKEHIPKFFSKWDEMLYVRTERWYDSHPRIFLECEFYGKKMHYFNDEEVKDGGWYRWKDVQENGIKDRTLTKEDEIIRQFI